MKHFRCGSDVRHLTIHDIETDLCLAVLSSCSRLVTFICHMDLSAVAFSVVADLKSLRVVDIRLISQHSGYSPNVPDMNFVTLLLNGSDITNLALCIPRAVSWPERVNVWRMPRLRCLTWCSTQDALVALEDLFAPELMKLKVGISDTFERRAVEARWVDEDDEDDVPPNQWAAAPVPWQGEDANRSLTVTPVALREENARSVRTLISQSANLEVLVMEVPNHSSSTAPLWMTPTPALNNLLALTFRGRLPTSAEISALPMTVAELTLEIEIRSAFGVSESVRSMLDAANSRDEKITVIVKRVNGDLFVLASLYEEAALWPMLLIHSAFDLWAKKHSRALTRKCFAVDSANTAI
jgi:hypothetical protein